MKFMRVQKGALGNMTPVLYDGLAWGKDISERDTVRSCLLETRPRPVVVQCSEHSSQASDVTSLPLCGL
jgi:hypothetical protein